jgi:peptidyl-prolyl cis-trans isomerase B (cyclophilin B)
MKKSLYLLLIFIVSASCTPDFSKTELELISIQTRLGEVLIWLHDDTPRHKQSFFELAEAHYWDSLSFNRVIPDFVAQGGCPDTPEGFSDSPYLLEPEFVDRLGHRYGALGAGRDGNPEKLSAGCQFYIVQNKEGVHRLDGDYTVFGQVIKGMEVVDAIVAVERDDANKPYEAIPVMVRKITLPLDEIKDLVNKAGLEEVVFPEHALPSEAIIINKKTHFTIKLGPFTLSTLLF